jgi:hypothetical protein
MLGTYDDSTIQLRLCRAICKSNSNCSLKASFSSWQLYTQLTVVTANLGDRADNLALGLVLFQQLMCVLDLLPRQYLFNKKLE